MLDTVPTAEELTNLVGKSLYEIWDSLSPLHKGENCGLKKAGKIDSLF